MDPLLVLLLLGLLCMAAMAPMMMLGGHRHWIGWYSDRASTASGDQPETAHEILDRRYASGELTKESYHAMLVDVEARGVTR